VSDVRAIRRALLAVYDKMGIVELAQGLRGLDVELVSSGGTAAALRAAGVDVTEVAEVTGTPEMLGGRVKTLHPKIHAGLLADRRNEEHVAQLRERGIDPFDLVVVNLYPFRETVASGAMLDDVIEKIDIGGPAMIRAGAKNFESVGVVVRPDRYGSVLDEIARAGEPPHRAVDPEARVARDLHDTGEDRERDRLLRLGELEPATDPEHDGDEIRREDGEQIEAREAQDPHRAYSAECSGSPLCRSHATVDCSPSRNAIRGDQPSSARARAGSATRRATSLAAGRTRSGSVSTFRTTPVMSARSFARSPMLISVPVPSWTVRPMAAGADAAAMKPATVSLT